MYKISDRPDVYITRTTYWTFIWAIKQAVFDTLNIWEGAREALKSHLQSRQHVCFDIIPGRLLSWRENLFQAPLSSLLKSEVFVYFGIRWKFFGICLMQFPFNLRVAFLSSYVESWTWSLQWLMRTESGVGWKCCSVMTMSRWCEQTQKTIINANMFAFHINTWRSFL